MEFTPITSPAPAGFADVPVRYGLSSEARVLYNLCKRLDAVIAGGYARYVAGMHGKNEPAGFGDVDIFPFRYWTHSHVVSVFLPLGYQEIDESENAYTFHHALLDSKVQWIRHVHADIEALLRSFDFTVCQAAIVDPGTVRVSSEFLVDEPARRLRLARLQNPIVTLQRALKYARRGYNLPTTQIAAILTQWTTADSDEWNALVADGLGSGTTEDQLTENARAQLGYTLLRRLRIAE